MDWDTFDEESAESWGAGAADMRPEEPPSNGVAFTGELVSDEGLRALSRDTGVPRTTLRRLREGATCSLANLAKLTEARPTLVVYVQGVPYRLVQADGVELAASLRAALEREAYGGARVIEGPAEVVCRVPQECSDCGADIPVGQTSLNTTLRDSVDGIQTRRQCGHCAGDLKGVNSWAGDYRRSVMVGTQ